MRSLEKRRRFPRESSCFKKEGNERGRRGKIGRPHSAPGMDLAKGRTGPIGL